MHRPGFSATRFLSPGSGSSAHEGISILLIIMRFGVGDILSDTPSVLLSAQLQQAAIIQLQIGSKYIRSFEFRAIDTQLASSLKAIGTQLPVGFSRHCTHSNQCGIELAAPGSWLTPLFWGGFPKAWGSNPYWI